MSIDNDFLGLACTQWPNFVTPLSEHCSIKKQETENRSIRNSLMIIMVCNSALLNLGEILKEGSAFFGIFVKELQFHLYDATNYLMLMVYISSKCEFRNLF